MRIYTAITSLYMGMRNWGMGTRLLPTHNWCSRKNPRHCSVCLAIFGWADACMSQAGSYCITRGLHEMRNLFARLTLLSLFYVGAENLRWMVEEVIQSGSRGHMFFIHGKSFGLQILYVVSFLSQNSCQFHFVFYISKAPFKERMKLTWVVHYSYIPEFTVCA